MGSGIYSDDSMVSTKGIVPWHTLGTVVPDDVLTSAQAIRLAKANFEVDFAPIVFNGVQVPKKVGQLVYRMDTGRPLGVVKGRYNIIQNEEAFDFLDALIETKEATIETAGTLNHGARLFIVANLPGDMRIAGDEYKKYVVLFNSHDGSCALMATMTGVRVVCANTWAMALQEADSVVKIRHTRNYESKLEEAQKVLFAATKWYEKFQVIGNQLAEVKFSKSDFDQMLATMFPVSDDKSKRGITMALNQREKVVQAYNASDLDNIRGTAMGALQAIIDHSDHGRKLKDMSKSQEGGDGYDNKERLFLRSLEDNDLKKLAAEFIQDRTGVQILVKV